MSETQDVKAVLESLPEFFAWDPLQAREQATGERGVLSSRFAVVSLFD